jgi:hypothetical protein
MHHVADIVLCDLLHSRHQTVDPPYKEPTYWELTFYFLKWLSQLRDILQYDV